MAINQSLMGRTFNRPLMNEMQHNLHQKFASLEDRNHQRRFGDSKHQKSHFYNLFFIRPFKNFLGL